MSDNVHDDQTDDESDKQQHDEGSAHVIVPSTSRSADAGHLAAADIVTIADEAGTDFRLIGGNAISLLVWRYDATDLVPERETNDADLGVPSQTVGAASLVEALVSNGYTQVAGNRFKKTVEHDGMPLPLEIDVLIPSHSSVMKSNQPFGDLVVDAIPGLAVAMARPPVLVEVTTTLTTGMTLSYTVPLPDPIAALCMKAYAFRWRLAPRDALDIWRLLEVSRQAGHTPDDWPRGASGRDAASILYSMFGAPGAAGPTQATADAGAQARIRALVLALVPRPSE